MSSAGPGDSTGNYKKEFIENGFVVVREAFTAKEVSAFRDFFQRVFSRPPERPGDRANIRTDVLNHYPELLGLVSNSKIRTALNEILGSDFVFIPDSTMHDSNLFGGWHRDTGAQERAGHLFHYEPDFSMITLAIYLQDNREDFGGGLDIVAKSYLTRPTWWQRQKSENHWLKLWMSRLIRRKLLPSSLLFGRKGKVSIPSRAGDAVIFHMQSDHKPTHPRVAVPESHRKLAFFVSCSANNVHAQRFVRFLKSRPDYPYLQNYRYSSEFLKNIPKEHILPIKSL